MKNSTQKLSGRELSRLRRQQMSQTGSVSLKETGRISPEKKAGTKSVVENTIDTNQANVAAELPSEAQSLTSNAQIDSHDDFEYCCDECKEKGLKEPCDPCQTKFGDSKTVEEMDAVCKLIESNPANASSSVRAYCRNRRKELSKVGKQALSGKVATQTRQTHALNNKNSMSGRDLAKLRREERCTVGLGNTEACRPSGRVRPRPGDAPAKVEIGTTLSGQTVSGSQVEQTEKITGSEAGGCKSVTGTEYLGAEQYQNLCSTTPEPKEGKVGETQTTKGQLMTGTLVESTANITGTEAGSCKIVTGNEYLGYDHYTQTCSKPNVVSSHKKVTAITSKKNSAITGVNDARSNAVTGTEYVSNERFVANYDTKAPLTPSKVSVDQSRKGMAITGNMMDRDQKVTGNEPGTCQRLTGSQYDSSATQGFCDQRSDKVSETHTITGNKVSGTEVSGSPKLTGDDQGSCMGVTGNEYISKESYEKRCAYVPMAAANKDNVSHTWNDQQVSGSQVSQSEIVTGDEAGGCNAITGSSYRSREEMKQFCDTSSIVEGEEVMRKTHTMKEVSGTTPIEDQRFSGNFNKGFDQPISGTPYLANQDSAEPYDASFSVQSPAHIAFENKPQKVHDSVFGINARITGPIAKAQGVTTGTPEFRHPLESEAASQAPITSEPTKVVTGEGNEDGISVTGDNWSRGGQITGTEGMFSANRNDTQKGNPNTQHKVGAHALKDREVAVVEGPKITNGSGGGGSPDGGSCRVTLSGGAHG